MVAVVGDGPQAAADLHVVEEAPRGRRPRAAAAGTCGRALLEPSASIRKRTLTRLRRLAISRSRSGRADVVGLVDVELDVDVVARRVDRGEEGVVGCARRPTSNSTSVARGDRHAAGRRAERDHLARPAGARRGCFRAAARVRPAPQSYAAAQALEPAPLEPLRPQEVIHQRSPRRAAARGAVSTAGRHRRALLQDDPDGHAAEVDRPGDRQPVTTCCWEIPPSHSSPPNRVSTHARSEGDGVMSCAGPWLRGTCGCSG